VLNGPYLDASHPQAAAAIHGATRCDDAHLCGLVECTDRYRRRAIVLPPLEQPSGKRPWLDDEAWMRTRLERSCAETSSHFRVVDAIVRTIECSKSVAPVRREHVVGQYVCVADALSNVGQARTLAAEVERLRRRDDDTGPLLLPQRLYVGFCRRRNAPVVCCTSRDLDVRVASEAHRQRLEWRRRHYDSSGADAPPDTDSAYGVPLYNVVLAELRRGSDAQTIDVCWSSEALQLRAIGRTFRCEILRLLETPANFDLESVPLCTHCRRALTDDESIRAGIDRQCRRKHASSPTNADALDDDRPWQRRRVMLH